MNKLYSSQKIGWFLGFYVKENSNDKTSSENTTTLNAPDIHFEIASSCKRKINERVKVYDTLRSKFKHEDNCTSQINRNKILWKAQRWSKKQRKKIL